jgi:hypothetical protein
MCKQLAFVLSILAVFCALEPLNAQFTDPHNYDNAPVGLNELELAYAYAHADSSIDTSITIAGARLDLNQGSIGYTRYFGLLHRRVWVRATFPFAGVHGSIAGTDINNSVTGTGDSSYEFGGLLKGGPALTAAQFENYTPTTVLGASLIVTAPTGLYDSSKILNLGSGRWSFKPEIALSHPFSPEQKWQLDLYANCYFFTDNTSYRGAEILRQQPLPGVEAHISYSFSKLWASLDTRYSFRGITFVNGTNQNNSQQNFSLGTEVNVSLSPRNSLVFQFDEALVHENGPAMTGFAVKYYYTWGTGSQ